MTGLAAQDTVTLDSIHVGVSRHREHVVQQGSLLACGRVLLVSSDEQDHASVRSVLAHSGLKLSFTQSFQEARAILRDCSVDVVISSGQSGDGYGWKDLLRELQDDAARTRLVVADRLADEALWAEVLNFGGYDLLLKPFDATELFRVVDMACRTHSWTELGAGQTKSIRKGAPPWLNQQWQERQSGLPMRSRRLPLSSRL